jgi:hypothetical protein
MSMQLPKAVRRHPGSRVATDDGGRFGARIMTPFRHMRTGSDPVLPSPESGGWWADSRLHWRGNDVFAAYSGGLRVDGRGERWER